MKADIHGMLHNTTARNCSEIKFREFPVAAVVTEPGECHAGRVIKDRERIRVVSLKLILYDSSKPADCTNHGEKKNILPRNYSCLKLFLHSTFAIVSYGIFLDDVFTKCSPTFFWNTLFSFLALLFSY